MCKSYVAFQNIYYFQIIQFSKNKHKKSFQNYKKNQIKKFLK